MAMNKRQRDTILASLRSIELTETDVEVADTCGNGYITGKVYELMRAVLASEETPKNAGLIKQHFNNIVQWAVCGIYRANKMEALDVPTT